MLETLEYVEEQFVDDIHHLLIVLVDSHLEIQASKLAEMPVRVGILRPGDSIWDSKYIPEKMVPAKMHIQREESGYEYKQNWRVVSRHSNGTSQENMP